MLTCHGDVATCRSILVPFYGTKRTMRTNKASRRTQSLRNALCIDNDAPSIDGDAQRVRSIAQHFRPMVPRKQQEKLRSRGRRTPVAVIELMATLAERHGIVAGIQYDAAGARAALARVKEARATAKEALRLARRAESDAVQTWILIADTTMAATVALSRFVRLPKNARFVEANEQIRALMRAKRNAR